MGNAASIWVQLFQHKGGGVLEAAGESHRVVLSSKSNVAGLKDAVKEKFEDDLTGISSARLLVYEPGTVAPTSTDPEALPIEPGTTVTIQALATVLPGDLLLGSVKFPRTTYSKPLVVTAPESSQNHEQQQPTGMQWEFTTMDDISAIDTPDLNKQGILTCWRREDGRTVVHNAFLRSHLVERKKKLDTFMKSDRKSKLYVNGPPGSGKTTFFLLYFTLWSRENSQRGLIVQYRERTACEIIILDKDKMARRATPSEALSNENICPAVKNLIRREDSFDFFVLDGVRQSELHCKEVLGLLNASFQGKKGVHVTSLQFDIKGGDGTAESDDFMTILSWDLEDYMMCYKHGLKDSQDWIDLLIMDDEKKSTEAINSLTESEDHDDDEEKEWILKMIARKFYYAGGSARFMFDYPLDFLVDQVLHALFNRMTPGLWSEFATLTVGSATSSCVSSLLQISSDKERKALPVSKYVFFKAYDNCKKELVKSVRAAAEHSRIPALKGWAFELEQIDLVNDGVTEGKAVSSKEGGLVLPTGPDNVFYDGRNLEGNITQDTFVIMCKKWDQGCFDMAVYHDHDLVTVDFTVSSSHSLKIAFIRHLKEALEGAEKTVCNIKHVGIVDEKETSKEFTFQSPEGAGMEDPEKLLYSIQLTRSTKLTKLVEQGPDVKLGCCNAQDANDDVVEVYAPRASKRAKRTPDFFTFS